MRTGGTEGTTELTIASVVFIHGTPSDVLGYYRPADTLDEV